MATAISTSPETKKQSAPTRYSGFDGQFIGDSWRAGREGNKEIDSDLYSGEVLTEIVLADKSDLDEAYHAAARAQVNWAAAAPAKRTEVMSRSLDIMKARHDEIIDWLVRESGSTLAKAELEWQFMCSVTAESASLPHRVAGQVLLSMNRVRRVLPTASRSG
jgi:aldehyde dehydrogenase (NAD+)